jgi:hypothetical protein
MKARLFSRQPPTFKEGNAIPSRVARHSHRPSRGTWALLGGEQKSACASVYPPVNTRAELGALTFLTYESLQISNRTCLENIKVSPSSAV